MLSPRGVLISLCSLHKIHLLCVSRLYNNTVLSFLWLGMCYNWCKTVNSVTVEYCVLLESDQALKFNGLILIHEPLHVTS